MSTKNNKDNGRKCNIHITAQEIQDMFPDDKVLRDAFKALLAIAKKHGGEVTDNDISEQLPIEFAREDDQERLFNCLHAVGITVKSEDDDPESISEEELRKYIQSGKSVVDSPVMKTRLNQLFQMATEREGQYLTYDEINSHRR